MAGSSVRHRPVARHNVTQCLIKDSQKPVLSRAQTFFFFQGEMPLVVFFVPLYNEAQHPALIKLPRLWLPHLFWLSNRDIWSRLRCQQRPPAFRIVPSWQGGNLIWTVLVWSPAKVLAGAIPSRRSLMFPQMDLKMLALFCRFCMLDWWSLCFGLIL